MMLAVLKAYDCRFCLEKLIQIKTNHNQYPDIDFIDLFTLVSIDRYDPGNFFFFFNP